jgi:hypothetical protein
MIAASYSAALKRECSRAVTVIQDRSSILIAVLIVTLWALFTLDIALAQSGSSTSELDFNDDSIRCAVSQLFLLIEGAFGALVMVVAGIGAIIAAAMGAYRAAVSMIVVSVGAFVLRSLVSLFFGTNFPECNAS